MRPDGKVIVSEQETDPMPVIIGAAEYPSDLIAKMQALGVHVDAVDALGMAQQAGTAKAANLVLMGRLSRYFDFSEEIWMQAIEDCVPAKFLELNKKAFMMGRGE